MALLINYSDAEHEAITKKLPQYGIFVIDNFMSKEKCSEIIKEIDLTATVNERDILSTSNVKALIPTYELSKKMYSQEYIFDKFSKLCYYFNSVYKLPCVSFDYPQYRKIYGNTKIHTDYILSRSVHKPRVLSCIIALNDNYEGGELIFPSQNYKIKLKQGQVICFPPYWTHPHYTNDLKKGTFRYTINTWLRE